MAADIASRSARLLQEMEKLRQHLWALKGENEHVRGLSGLISSIHTEKEAAEQFLAPSEPNSNGASSQRTKVSRFRSTNIYTFEKLWDIIKRCHRLISINQTLAKTTKLESDCQGGLQLVDAAAKAKGGVTKNPGLLHIHAIVGGGAEWLRIIHKNEKKLLMEMAEGGWDWDVGEGDQDDAALYEDIETLRSAKDLADAARENWYNYRHPRIRIIFTRIRDGQNKEIDRLIQRLRRVGGDDITVDIHCADSEWVTNEGLVDIDTAIANLMPRADNLTDTVILDSSVLVALVSDVSHTKVDKLPWHGEDVRAHIDDEANGINFFRCAAYPHLRGRKLVCTGKAKEQFEKIALLMGSPTEVERARVLFGGGAQDLQKYSIHTVPDDFLLPVQVLPGDDEEWSSTAKLIRDGVLPPVATEVERHLVGVLGNMATHMCGWVSGLTVVTSNRVLARKIVSIVETSLTREYANGPRICALPYNRALATNGPGPKKARKLAKLGLWPPRGQ